MIKDSEDVLMIIHEAEEITKKQYIEWTDGDKLEGYVSSDYISIIDDLIEVIKNG